jgi:ribonucleoside-triphosphate reductase (formate)
MKVIKRDGTEVPFSKKKIENVLRKAFVETQTKYDTSIINRILSSLKDYNDDGEGTLKNKVSVEEIQDIVEKELMLSYPIVAKAYIVYRERHRVLRDFVKSKEEFINKYKKSNNTADTTIDDNSNVSSKNIGVLNNEIHKQDNIQVSRGMVMRKLKELYPDFDSKQYIKDLEHHIIYKHDESSFAGAIAPYCVSCTMYPFLLNGIKGLGGLSAAPKNLRSFCGIYINMIFAISSQFAGAVATSEFFLYFDYFARKEWGGDYYLRKDDLAIVSKEGDCSIQKQIHQLFQQVVYSINQPAAARGMQSAFVNFSYFDKPFFESMFGEFYFPDGTQPIWESLSWLQKEFMMWFNEERLKCMLTFPVESFALIYKDDDFVDKDSADFVAQEYARGHSFFTYISDTADSLSSCCRLKNKLQVKEFNFTNGNIGIQTGSKSVITLNLNRITQDAHKKFIKENLDKEDFYQYLKTYLEDILERVYKYHNAYNELLWDMYNSDLLPVYKAGFINLNKQYLTIGINGLNEAAEYLDIECSDNEKYKEFCQLLFSTIKEDNIKHKTNKLNFNTECVPAESLAVKNYNWDKNDGYKVPKDRNLYASYIFIPSSKRENIIDRIRMHGREYIGEYLDGGSAAHLNLSEHLSEEQYKFLLKYAAENGCQYLTFNIPNTECKDCGFITKHPLDKCPKCGSENVVKWDRIIGYLTAIPSWSEGRRKEQQTRDYTNKIK